MIGAGSLSFDLLRALTDRLPVMICPRWLPADNCRLDRSIRELVKQLPFQAVELDEFYMQRAARTHGYLYRGVAAN